MGYLLDSRPCWCEYLKPSNFLKKFSTCLTCYSQGQYVDGLRTPFVIHPPEEVASYDEEFTIILGDWYHEQHSELIKSFINIKNPGGAEPVPGQYYFFFYILLNSLNFLLLEILV